MKLDRIKVKLTGSQAGTATTANISPTVVLAFDRNGLSTGQTPTPELIATYSSSQVKQWSQGNAFVMYQTIYPSTIMEKGMYIATDSLLDPTSEGTDDVPENPCNLYCSPQLPFKPITLIGLSTQAIDSSAAQTFSFNVELSYTVTFRGMRKPKLT